MERKKRKPESSVPQILGHHSHSAREAAEVAGEAIDSTQVFLKDFLLAFLKSFPEAGVVTAQPGDSSLELQWPWSLLPLDP